MSCGLTKKQKDCKETGFNQIKTKTTELVIVRAGPVEKSIELTTYPMQQEPEDTYD
jgi:hypothetical protein